jgi:hypothetical protein
MNTFSMEEENEEELVSRRAATLEKHRLLHDYSFSTLQQKK